MRAWLKRNLPPAAVEKLRAARNASAQALAGADLYHLRVDLERRIEERLHESGAIQDARIHARVMEGFREELANELDRWAQDMMERMDILVSASNRVVASLEDRIDRLERRLEANTGGPSNGRAAETRSDQPTTLPRVDRGS